MGFVLFKVDLGLLYVNLIYIINYFFVLLNCFLVFILVFGMCIYCLGLFLVVKKEISFKVVRWVCCFDEINISMGLVGECVLIVLKVGLFIVVMCG